MGATIRDYDEQAEPLSSAIKSTFMLFKQPNFMRRIIIKFLSFYHPRKAYRVDGVYHFDEDEMTDVLKEMVAITQEVSK